MLDALEELPTLRAGETFELWEQEAGALIEDYAARNVGSSSIASSTRSAPRSASGLARSDS